MSHVRVNPQMPNLFIYTIGYILFAIGLIYPPIEFVSAGFTIPELFSRFLGNEYNEFVQYHIKRSIVTLLVHSLLPFGYILGLTWLGHLDAAQVLLGIDHPLWLTLSLCALIGPVYALSQIVNWSRDDFAKHPIAKSLEIHCNDEYRTWLDVAASVNSEFASYSKLQIHINSTSKVVVTHTWIMKVSAYKLEIANQWNSAMVAYDVNSYESSPTRGRAVHYVRYMVVTGQPGGENFTFKIKNSDTRMLLDMVRMPTRTLSTVVIPKTVREVHVLGIKEEAAKNAPFTVTEDPDACAICLETTANVKLVKNCHNEPNVENEDEEPDDSPECQDCRCPPIFCINCLAEWFVIRRTRDDEEYDEYTTQKKSTCPQCRSVFCLRDVRLVSVNNETSSNQTDTENK